MAAAGHLHRVLLIREGSTEKINITTRKDFSTLKDTLGVFAEDICGVFFLFGFVCFDFWRGVVWALFGGVGGGVGWGFFVGLNFFGGVVLGVVCFSFLFVCLFWFEFFS